MKRIDAAIAIIVKEQQVLICQRRANDSFGGYWEFPGGKRQNDETLHQCLARELQEELAIVAPPYAPLPPIDHDYPAVHLRLHPFLCRHASGEPQPLACQQVRWVPPAQLRAFRFPPANEHLIGLVIDHLAAGAGG